MVDAAPFAALRYDPAVAGDAASTSAPAYDDLEPLTYARHRAASPYTVLELLTGDDDGGAEAYRSAGATFRRWLRTGVVSLDPHPAFYVYEIHELRSGVPTVLRGVLAAVALDGGGLLPHEHVDERRVAARERRLDVVPADLAPVFAVSTAAPAPLRAMLDRPPVAPPVIAFTDEAGIDHRVWAVRDPDGIRTVAEGLAGVAAVIADGHHRYEAARARARRSQTPGGRTLAYVVDGTAFGPELRAVHRLITPATTLLDRVAADFSVHAVPFDHLAGELAAQPGVAFGLCLPGRSFLLVARTAAALRRRLPDGHSEAWQRLDAAVFEHAVRPLLDGAAVTYRADLPAAAAEVAGSGDAALFVLRAPTLDDVFACARAGEALPVKSTLFRPKPRAGLVMRSLDSP